MKTYRDHHDDCTCPGCKAFNRKRGGQPSLFPNVRVCSAHKFRYQDIPNLIICVDARSCRDCNAQKFLDATEGRTSV